MCNGGHAADVTCAAGTGASFLSGSPAGAGCARSSLIAAFAPIVRGAPVAGRALFSRPPKTLRLPAEPLWGIASAGVRRCPLLPSGLNRPRAPPLYRGSATQLQISLTISGDDDEEVKKDYQQADQDGSRIFISGLAPSVDEKRLILALQSYQGVVEVKLAKPGLGFALFMDPAAADVAIESLQGIKLSGKALTVRRARSFYIQQQQQATMQKAIDERMREQGLPTQYPTQSRDRGAPPVSPSSLDMRRASLTFNTPRPPRPGMPPVRSNMGEVNRLLPKIREEEEERYRVAEEEERIRKQALMEVMREGDVKKNRRRRRVQGELVDLPELPPDEIAKSRPQ